MLGSRFRPVVRSAAIAVILLVIPAVAFGAPAPPSVTSFAPFAAEVTAPPASNPAPVVEPLPLAPAPPPAPESAPTPTVVTLDPPTTIAVAPESDPPIFEKWWFWTAIAAFAVTAVVIVATSSGPNTPKTDLGNMPAF